MRKVIKKKEENEGRGNRCYCCDNVSNRCYYNCIWMHGWLLFPISTLMFYVSAVVAGARLTSEGFETSSSVERILLWGSFGHDVPLIVSRSVDVIVHREQKERLKRIKEWEKTQQEEESQFIDDAMEGELLSELQLGDGFVDA